MHRAAFPHLLLHDFSWTSFFSLGKVVFRRLLADVDTSKARHHSMLHKAEKCEWKNLSTHSYSE